MMKSPFSDGEVRGKFHSPLENAVEGIFQTSPEGRLLSANQALARILGYESAEDLIANLVNIGQGYYVDPGTCTKIEQALEERDIAFGLEYQAYCRDGRKIWVHENIHAVRNQSGALLYYEGSIEDISERKRVEEALSKSERELRLIAENATEVIYAYDMNRRLIYVNPAIEILTGYSVDELREKDFISWIHVDDEARMMELGEGLYEGRGFADQEYRLITKGGQEKWGMSSWGPLFDEEGQQVGIQGRETDITERKRMEIEHKDAEETLRASEQRYRLLFEQNLAGVYCASLDGQILDCNVAAARILGFDTPEELMRQQVADLFFDAAEKVAVIARLWEKGELTNVELCLKKKDGSPVWILQNVNLLESGEGKSSRFQGTLIDITERGLAAKALKEANQRAIIKYERLLERISSLGQTLGMARDLQTVFRAVRDFAQVSAPCDSIVISLCDPERSERTASYVWSNGEELDVENIPVVKLNGGPASRVIASQSVLITHDFRKIILERGLLTIGPPAEKRLPDSALTAPMTIKGRTIGIIEIQSYESNAYMSEHSIAIRMAANLAAIAIENVRLFDAEHEKEEQLRQSQKMEAVGKLAGGVAHDFNNLLTVITGYSELTLRRLNETDPLRRNIEEIKVAGDRAASLTRQLLAFSRKQVLQPEVMDFNAVLVEMFKMLQRLIGEDIDLLPVLDPSLGQIKADPGQIHQVLMNLAVNARDAMPQGGKLTIKTANIDIDEEYASHHVSVRPGRYVMLSVSDSGSGMDEATQARIFEPFFTTKEVGKGTGLGLSTVYGIIKQSGGNIWVYSEVGKGTTFKIYLPRADQEFETIEDSVSDDLPVGTETILLVEDEEMVRHMTREILQLSGYRVIEAMHGVDALQVCKLHDGPIQLMLTDVVMPQMGGRVLAEQAAQLRPEMRVLYMSGYTDDAIVHHGVLDKNMAFIEKPFPPDALARKVREVLDAGSA